MCLLAFRGLVPIWAEKGVGDSQWKTSCMSIRNGHWKDPILGLHKFLSLRTAQGVGTNCSDGGNRA